MTTGLSNIDLQCVSTAQEIAAEPKADEDGIRKILGVLQEDGLTACFLYALSLKEKKGADRIVEHTSRLLHLYFPTIVGEGVRIKSENLPAIMRELGANLDRLFFAKEILEKALIYARYYAKARETVPAAGEEED